MFQNSGLSLEQAPPIKVIFRFFLSGAIFGVVASIMLFFWHNNLSNFSNPTTLAFVHTLTLGVMASFMLGALFQMMPVICGVHIKAPINASMRVNYALFFGTIFLVVYFINGSLILLYLTFLSLGYALFSATYIMLKELKKIEHSNASRGMSIALTALAIAVVIALLMLLLRAGVISNLNYLDLKNIHFNFALFGWIFILVVSVSLQVIEMFYVTPKYKSSYAKYITITTITTLFIYAILTFINCKESSIILTIIYLATIAHALYTLYNIKRKKRPVNDATIWFWVISMSALALFGISMLLNISATLSATLFAIFALSVVFAMVYKIVPFLVWFHLNAQGYFDAPMMHEVVSLKYARVNMWILFIASIFSIVAVYFNKIYYIATFFWFISFFMLLLTIYRAWHKYLHTLKYGKKMNFSFN